MADMFLDSRGNEITEGPYRKIRDRSSVYLFTRRGTKQIGLSPHAPVWLVHRVSVQPPISEKMSISRGESSQYIPIDDSRIKSMLIDACGRLREQGICLDNIHTLAHKRYQ